MADIKWIASGLKDGQPVIHLLRGETFSVLVHRHSRKPGFWFVSSHCVGIKDIPLKNTDLQTAKEEALVLISHRLSSLAEEVEQCICTTLAEKPEEASGTPFE